MPCKTLHYNAFLHENHCGVCWSLQATLQGFHGYCQFWTHMHSLLSLTYIFLPFKFQSKQVLFLSMFHLFHVHQIKRGHVTSLLSITRCKSCAFHTCILRAWKGYFATLDTDISKTWCLTSTPKYLKFWHWKSKNWVTCPLTKPSFFKQLTLDLIKTWHHVFKIGHLTPNSTLPDPLY